MNGFDQEIFEKVRFHVVEALCVEEGEVTPDARLMDDLGAESIDFLDIFFRVEKAFDIKLETSASEMIHDERYVRDGIVTDEGLEEIRRRLPHVDLGLIEESRSVQDIQRSFTVESVVEMVKGRVGGDVGVA